MANDLFRENENSPTNIRVSSDQGFFSFWDYSRGYFEAAELVYRNLTQSSASRDTLLYPIVFLNRQAIELCLKHFGIRLPLVFGELKKVYTTHRLLDNWLLIKPYLQKVTGDCTNYEHFFSVDKLLDDFAQFDPNGEAFRFPRSKQGEFSLKNLRAIDLESFFTRIRTARQAFEHWYNATDKFENELIDDYIFEELEDEDESDDLT